MVLAMSAIGYLLVILIVFSAMFGSDQANQNRILQEAEVDAVAGNLMVYRNIVTAYAEANPTAIGTIEDITLGLPTWYQRQPGMSNFLAGGKSYVFYTGSLPGLISNLAGRIESMSVGTNSGGVLTSPKAGNTGIPLPAQVPQSAVVIVQ